MTLNEFFAKHDLGVVEVFHSKLDGSFKAIRGSHNRAIMDSFFGTGDTPEAALSDLMQKVNAGPAARPQPAPIAIQEPVVPDLDDLLG